MIVNIDNLRTLLAKIRGNFQVSSRENRDIPVKAYDYGILKM